MASTISCNSHPLSTLCPNPSVVDCVSSFLNAPQEGPSAKRLIDLLNKDPDLNRLYEMSAGVGEEYSVGQHTRMVVESFELEFQDRVETREILNTARLTNRQFMFFLALHDIGKGIAVDEQFQKYEEIFPSEERKEMELKYSTEIIAQWSSALKIESTCLPIFKGLLLEDEIGEFAVGRRTFRETVESVNKGAEISGLPPRSYLHLKALFHQIDAASYPFVRTRFFEIDRSSTVTLGHISGLPKYVGYSNANKTKIDQIEEAVKSS